MTDAQHSGGVDVYLLVKFFYLLTYDISHIGPTVESHLSLETCMSISDLSICLRHNCLVLFLFHMPSFSFLFHRISCMFWPKTLWIHGSFPFDCWDRKWILLTCPIPIDSCCRGLGVCCPVKSSHINSLFAWWLSEIWLHLKLLASGIWVQIPQRLQSWNVPDT